MTSIVKMVLCDTGTVAFVYSYGQFVRWADMGKTTPPILRMPTYGYRGVGSIPNGIVTTNRCVKLDLRDILHEHAWYRFEAEREFETWPFLICTHPNTEYTPLDPATLYFRDGKVTMVQSKPVMKDSADIDGWCNSFWGKRNNGRGTGGDNPPSGGSAIFPSRKYDAAYVNELKRNARNQQELERAARQERLNGNAYDVTAVMSRTTGRSYEESRRELEVQQQGLRDTAAKEKRARLEREQRDRRERLAYQMYNPSDPNAKELFDRRVAGLEPGFGGHWPCTTDPPDVGPCPKFED